MSNVAATTVPVAGAPYVLGAPPPALIGGVSAEGRYHVAESVLLTMEQGAPDWSAHHRLPRMLVGELLSRGRPSVRLQELSQRLHVTTGARHRE